MNNNNNYNNNKSMMFKKQKVVRIQDFHLIIVNLS